MTDSLTSQRTSSQSTQNLEQLQQHKQQQQQQRSERNKNQTHKRFKLKNIFRWKRTKQHVHFRQHLLISINKQRDAILQASVYDSLILYQCSKSTFIISFGYIVFDMPRWVEMTEQIDWRGTVISGLRFRKSEVLRSLRFYLLAQSHGHHTVDRLEGRGVERRSARRSPLKGRERAVVSQTNIGTGSIFVTGWST